MPYCQRYQSLCPMVSLLDLFIGSPRTAGVNVEGLSPRHAIAFGLLALIPVIWYAVGRSSTGGLVAAVNVLIIVAALYVAVQPLSESPRNDCPV